jgi:DNA-binding MarR family transcriptional regulator
VLDSSSNPWHISFCLTQVKWRLNKKRGFAKKAHLKAPPENLNASLSKINLRLNNLPKQTQPTLLRDKGEFTKFQILLEIKRNQPHIKQKQIAEALGITIQAISKYFKKLTKEGLLESGTERADYRLTPKAIGKLHDDLRNLENYVQTVKQEMKIERALPAITTHPSKQAKKSAS